MTQGWRTAGTILFFGTLWGASEVILNEVLRSADVPRTTVVLTVVSVLILGLAAVRLPRFGALVGVALVAGAYRTATAGPFWCHVLAVVVSGLVFDGLRTVLRPDALRPARTAFLGAVAALLAHVVFGVLITYLFAYRHWTGDGGARLRDYVLVSGGLAAAASGVLLPLSLTLQARVGGRVRGGADRVRQGPRAVAGCATLLLWVVGFLV